MRDSPQYQRLKWSDSTAYELNFPIFKPAAISRTPQQLNCLEKVPYVHLFGFSGYALVAEEVSEARIHLNQLKG